MKMRKDASSKAALAEAAPSSKPATPSPSAGMTLEAIFRDFFEDHVTPAPDGFAKAVDAFQFFRDCYAICHDVTAPQFHRLMEKTGLEHVVLVGADKMPAAFWVGCKLSYSCNGEALPYHLRLRDTEGPKRVPKPARARRAG